METTEVPYSRNIETTYENFIADCPYCSTRNIFNRASDLKTFKPIGFKVVSCQTCNQWFNINRDVINAAHEMFLFGCFSFIQHKEYMQCVLSVAQAYEVFFNHFLHVQLVYRAYASDDSNDHDLPHLNRLMHKLYNHVHRLTFEPLRCLVLRLVIDGVAPTSLAAAERAIEALPKNPPRVSRRDIESTTDDSVRALLLRLLDADVNVLRNRVVHKDAYRPTREEAIHAHDEAREVLHGLTVRLRLGYDAESGT